MGSDEALAVGFLFGVLCFNYGVMEFYVFSGGGEVIPYGTWPSFSGEFLVNIPQFAFAVSYREICPKEAAAASGDPEEIKHRGKSQVSQKQPTERQTLSLPPA